METTFSRFGLSPFMPQPAQGVPVAEVYPTARIRKTQVTALGNPDVPVAGSFMADHPALFERMRAAEKGLGILDFMGLEDDAAGGEDGRMRNC